MTPGARTSESERRDGESRIGAAKLRLLYKSSPALRRGVRELRDAALYRSVRALLAMASRCPLERALRIGDRVADLAYRGLPRTRELALQHLALVHGDRLSRSEREEIVRQSLRGFARSLCELLKIDEIRPRFDEYVHVSGWEAAESILDRGGIVCSAHLGNWELLAAYMVQVKGVQVAAVARRLNDRRLNQLLVDWRSQNGVTTILRDSPTASRQLLRILKSRGFLAMLVDQDTKVPSLTVPFLGMPARTPVAPALLAVRRRLPVVVAYCLRRPAGGLDLIVKEPIYADQSLDRDSSIRELTERTNQMIGEAILEHPAEWPWWHRRWRRPPQPGLDPDAPSEH